ncbi:MAG TPA: ERF family protein, partial [Hyphomicrobiaceae bacterium]|nr:ERF family protein [Hyphomicrobiaceae bacterium]
MRSPDVGELAAALAKAQGSMRNATLNRTNPHFKSRYADLASVFDAIRKPLADNGLAVSQLIDDGRLVTLLMHSGSGEWLSSEMTLPTAA